MIKSAAALHLEFREWAQKYEKNAKREVFASRSWKLFPDLGFSDRLMSLCFYLACDFADSPGYQWQAGNLRESRRRATQSKQLVSRLESMRNDVCEWLSIPRDVREQRDSIVDDHEHGMTIAETEVGVSKRQSHLTVKSSGFVVCAESDTEIVLKALGDPEVGSEELSVRRAKAMQMMEAFDLAIARIQNLHEEWYRAASRRNATPNFYLALGMHLIRSRAGSPLYRDYTILLNTAYHVFGRDELQCSEDSVRKTYQRFIKRNPRTLRYELAPGVRLTRPIIFDARDR